MTETVPQTSSSLEKEGERVFQMSEQKFPAACSEDHGEVAVHHGLQVVHHSEPPCSPRRSRVSQYPPAACGRPPYSEAGLLAGLVTSQGTYSGAVCGLHSMKETHAGAVFELQPV